MLFVLLLVFGLALTDASWAVYGVRITDLRSLPKPPNQVRVWGKVTSDNPVNLFDGRAFVPVIGISAAVGDFVTATGDWDGAYLRASQSAGHGHSRESPLGLRIHGSRSSLMLCGCPRASACVWWSKEKEPANPENGGCRCCMPTTMPISTGQAILLYR